MKRGYGGEGKKKTEQATKAGSSDPARGRKKGLCPGASMAKKTEIAELKNEIKRRKHSSTHEMKNSGFPLRSNTITPNPRRSPPSLPLLIETKIGSLLI
jgi:hypothetical protein